MIDESLNFLGSARSILCVIVIGILWYDLMIMVRLDALNSKRNPKSLGFCVSFDLHD